MCKIVCFGRAYSVQIRAGMYVARITLTLASIRYETTAANETVYQYRSKSTMHDI